VTEGNGLPQTSDVDAQDAPRKVPTIYDVAIQLLREHGWQQGAEVGRKGSLSITAAVEAAARRHAGSAYVPHELRVARARRHVRSLARTTSLLAWNDDPERRIEDVFELLTSAAAMYPDD
jgi:hypothetical protein